MVRTDDLQILRLALSPLRHDLFLEVGRFISAIMKLDDEVTDMKVRRPLPLQYPNAVILLFFPVLEATVRGHLGCINSSGLHHKKDKSVNCTAIWST